MHGEKRIFCESVIKAELKEVWKAWTTEEGIKSFFAPECKINLVPGGVYEMYFTPESPNGTRGGEGCQVLAVQPMKMLSFTWNAPPSIPDIRNQFTHVLVRFCEHPEETHIKLFHDGWGTGPEWNQAFSYFSTAWTKVVLPRLKIRFTQGPINWQNPPLLRKE